MFCIFQDNSLQPIAENKSDQNESELSKVLAKIRQKTIKNGNAVK